MYSNRVITTRARDVFLRPVVKSLDMENKNITGAGSVTTATCTANNVVVDGIVDLTDLTANSLTCSGIATNFLVNKLPLESSNAATITDANITGSGVSASTSASFKTSLVAAETLAGYDLQYTPRAEVYGELAKHLYDGTTYPKISWLEADQSSVDVDLDFTSVECLGADLTESSNVFHYENVNGYTAAPVFEARFAGAVEFTSATADNGFLMFVPQHKSASGAWSDMETTNVFSSAMATISKLTGTVVTSYIQLHCIFRLDLTKPYFKFVLRGADITVDLGTGYWDYNEDGAGELTSLEFLSTADVGVNWSFYMRHMMDL